MSRKLSRSDALEDISNWNTSDVLALLRKNGLENCCKAVEKRQVDGDELLHLTEGKLALWKSDLTRPLIRSLWSFVEEVKKAPEKFVLEERVIETQQSDDHLSDISWDTDFEDDPADDDVDVPNTGSSTRSSIRHKATRVAVREAVEKAETGIDERLSQVEPESTYANFDSVQDADNVYANFDDAPTTPTKNISRLHGQSERTLVEQLKEQLKLRNTQKPAIHPKPENLMMRKMSVGLIEGNNVDQKLPQKSFLHDPTKIKRSSGDGAQRRMAVPPPAEPRLPPKPKSSLVISKQEKLAAKPALTIRNLDLVANLPTKTEESEDEYEQFDEQIIEQNQKKENISRVSSKLSLASGNRSSAESVYQPPSITSYDEEEEPYEIYESITETPEDNGYYLSPIQRTSNSQTPPPLPAKLPSNTPSPTPSLTRPEKPKERSPDKKSATLPHSGSSTSLTNERATRPLPPPPDRLSYTDKPWYHNISREEAASLIKEQVAYGTAQDGCFLLRPSAKNVNNPLALVLWYRDRVYNVPVRKRPDNRYALGSPKPNEQSFSNVEEIVNFYMREELVLSTGGIQTGSTKLTTTPPK